MAPAIEVRRLGVRYSLRLNRHNTVRDSILSVARRTNAPGHFWALRDVSFAVDQRESLAVIGPNGAGKSTLLQVLAGILEPTEGWVRVTGRVTSMLTVGVGFDPDLTGRDNILLAGAFMGLDHRQTMSKLDEIIEFAGLGPFIDAKIKTYSSGMNARLGFSIATALDPDVLVIDEVLGTGDATFRAKSQARIKELMRAARAIVLVTHDMHWPVEFCNRAILLEQGQVVAAGDPAEVVKLHEERSDQRRQGIQPEPLEPVIDSGLGAGHFASQPASGS